MILQKQAALKSEFPKKKATFVRKAGRFALALGLTAIGACNTDVHLTPFKNGQVVSPGPRPGAYFLKESLLAAADSVRKQTHADSVQVFTWPQTKNELYATVCKDTVKVWPAEKK